MTHIDDEQDKKIAELEASIKPKENGMNGNLNKLILGTQGKIIGVLATALVVCGGFIFTKVVLGNINTQQVRIDEVSNRANDLKTKVEVHEEQIITLKKGFDEIKSDVKDTKKSMDDQTKAINELKILLMQIKNK